MSHIGTSHGDCVGTVGMLAKCRSSVLQCVAVCCSVLQCVAVCWYVGKVS